MHKRTMKQTNIKWAETLPGDWRTERLQFVLKERNKKNDPIESDNILSLSVHQGVIPYSERESGGNKPKEDLSAYKLVKSGDIVMNSMNIISGSVGISKYDGCVSPVYYMFRGKTEGSTKYYNYVFQTDAFQKSLLGLGNGILIRETEDGKFNTVRMRVPIERLKKYILPSPSVEEQEAIANYLDEKCKKIDIAIEEAKKSEEIYKIYKQKLITELTCKGTRHHSFVSSGVKWIGKIPDVWEVKKLKNICTFGKGLGITKADLVERGVPVISYGQIHSKDCDGIHLTEKLLRYIPVNHQAIDDGSKLKAGDIIFADTSEDVSGIGNAVLFMGDDDTYAGYHTVVLRMDDTSSSKYLAYLFKSDLWRNQIRMEASGIKVFSITQKALKKCTIILPRIDEQEEIVRYLDEKCKKIDAIISEKEELIKELEAYKKSLIYECVTGKREVS